jgi:hypothetical protein
MRLAVVAADTVRLAVLAVRQVLAVLAAHQALAVTLLPVEVRVAAAAVQVRAVQHITAATVQTA